MGLQFESVGSLTGVAGVVVFFFLALFFTPSRQWKTKRQSSFQASVTHLDTSAL